MTEEELAAIREQHHELVIRAQGEEDHCCAAPLCDQDWPCDASLLLIEVDRLRAALAEMEREYTSLYNESAGYD